MQDQYRKGLALGLTMAEVMILLLFGLLLALVHSVNEQRVAKQMLAQCEKKLKQYDDVPEDWREVIAECERENQELRAENNDLRELLKGIDRPPCWKEAIRKPYFSFNVAITPDGYEFRRRQIPGEDAASYEVALHDEAVKLHHDITTDRVSLSLGEMKARTAALDQWSRANGCVFFVIIEDRTGSQATKEFYKERIRALTNVFFRGR